MSKPTFKCCICGKEVTEYGNDPWPGQGRGTVLQPLQLDSSPQGEKQIK